MSKTGSGIKMKTQICLYSTETALTYSYRLNSDSIFLIKGRVYINLTVGIKVMFAFLIHSIIQELLLSNI